MVARLLYIFSFIFINSDPSLHLYSLAALYSPNSVLICSHHPSILPSVSSGWVSLSMTKPLNTPSRAALLASNVSARVRTVY